MIKEFPVVSYTPELIVLVLGSVVSLLFKYFPALNTWYAAKRTEVKSGIMIGLMLFLSGVIMILAHFQVIATDMPITIWRVVITIYLVTTSNQFTYLIFPEPKPVKLAKENSLERPGPC